jgi:hypothetical protein
MEFLPITVEKFELTSNNTSPDRQPNPPPSALTPPPSPPKEKRQHPFKRRRNLDDIINTITEKKRRPTAARQLQKSIKRSIFHSITSLAESAVIAKKPEVPKPLPPVLLEAPEMPPVMKPPRRGQPLWRHITEQAMRKHVLQFYIKLREDILAEQTFYAEDVQELKF